MTPERKIKDLLTSRSRTLSTAESCTGGMVASALTSVSGASEYFQGSIVAYQNSVKVDQLGVSPEDIAAYDVVSRQVVEQMVKGACVKFGTDYALASTGYADKGNECVPDGTIWIGWGSESDVHSKCLHLDGTREANTRGACKALLENFLDFLDNDSSAINADGRKQGSAATFKGHIVDLVSRRIFGGQISVSDGKIASVRECEVAEDAPYFLPGFVDSHVHIESAMMTPVEFSRIALSHGTIGAVCDPHEIANVMGEQGIELMLDLASLTDFRFAFGMPSCVPSCSSDIETSGFVLGPDKVEKFLKRDDIFFLAEMMNFPGVLGGDPQVMAKIAAAKAAGKPVDGHAPGLVGEERAGYAAAGISTDHECTSIETGRSAIECGMYVQIREGSASKDYAALAPLIAQAPGRIMFCCDDCHPNDLIRGHIDSIVRRAIADGYDVMDVLTAACLTPVKHYRIPAGLLQVGDPADFIVLSDLSAGFRVIKSYINGRKVYSSKGQFTASRMLERSVRIQSRLVRHMMNNFHARPISVADIARVPRKVENIIVASDGSLFTMNAMGSVTSDVQKLVVLDRYNPDSKPQVAYIKGFGLTKGAFAQSIAHDCHNIVAVGCDDNDIVRVVNRVIEMKGGIAATDGNAIQDLPLPIGGILSPMNGHELAFRLDLLNDVVRSSGCKFHSPFITLSFMCLPVIPQLKLTDKGLFDSIQFRFVQSDASL